MKFFISSTFRDLKDLRQTAINIVKGFIVGKNSATGEVVAMEFFSASENTPKEVCLDELSKCDIVIGIYGGRYGTIDVEEGISMTEIEFDYATKHNIPVLAFVHQIDEIEESQKKFLDEKVKMLKNTYTYFSTETDFADKLNRTLKNYFKNFEGYSVESLWTIVRDTQKSITDEWQMKSYSAGQEEKAIEDIIFSAKMIKEFIGGISEVNYAVSTYAYKYCGNPKAMTQEDIDGLVDNVQNCAETIRSNWEKIDLGLNNHTTKVLLAASYLSLSRIETRLLTEPWAEDLRIQAINARNNYIEYIKSSRHID